MIGQTISHYRITEKLGEGGMGVVYKAEDSTLDRTVALKFLAEHLLNDDEAKQRFLREAKVAAALDHPNICTVYEIAEDEGRTFLAMAFLKGDTLEDRIAKAPLPLKDALEIGRQVAEGLEAAHEAGIVHRDIKPANILIDPKGRATIMDFGLARLTEATRLTKVDTAMGTVAYMSPEQAQGIEVDHRSDIWALGCVLYEMVCGQRPFKGQYDQALFYEIVHEQPAALTGLRTGVPIELELLTAKCLAKDPEDRYQAVKEIAVDLRTLAEKLKSGRSTIVSRMSVPDPSQTGATTVSVPNGPLSGLRFREGATSQGAMTVYRADDVARGESLVVRVVPEAAEREQARRRLIRNGAAGLVFVLAAVAWWLSRPEPASAPLVTALSIPLDPAFVFPQAAVSPDGKTIAYISGFGPTGTGEKITLRNFDGFDSRVLEGTENARDLVWSPDSRWIAFWQRDIGLRKVSVEGGVPIPLADASSQTRPGGWNSANQILAAMDGDLFLFPANGGEPTRILDVPDDEIGYANRAHFIPGEVGGGKLLFSASNDIGVLSGAALFLHDTASGTTTRLGAGIDGGYDGLGKRLIFNRGSAAPGVWALPLDLDNPDPDSEAVLLIPQATLAALPAGDTLVYFPVPEVSERQMVWRNRSGGRVASIGRPQSFIVNPEISPDGRSVAAVGREGGEVHIWIHEIARPVKTRVPGETEDAQRPMWSADGRALLYSRAASPQERSREIWRIRTDGTGGQEVIYQGEIPLVLSDWLPRLGRVAIQQETGPVFDILTLQASPSGEYEASPLVATEANEVAPKISPDGRYVAYCSNFSGDWEVYVRPFSGGEGRWQVSTAGGISPRWSDDGRELFYVRDLNTLMAVEVSTQPTFTMGEQAELFQSQYLYILPESNRYPAYDVAPDGQRFVLIEPSGELPQPELRVIRNWSEAFPAN